MKKLFADFKAFISKGNVINLAVGMIIGSAFTAIVNSLVNGLLKPLINAIPGVDGTSALQLVLIPAEVDAVTGAVLKDAVVLDFGAVISAIITFLMTAIILFIIIKAVASVQRKQEKIKAQLKKAREDKLRAEGKLPPLEEEKEEEVTPVEEKLTTEELLEQIRDLLMAQNQAKETSAVIATEMVEEKE